MRRALHRPSVAAHRNGFVRHAHSIMRGGRYWDDPPAIRALLDTNPRRWRQVFEEHNWEIDDDPVPAAFLESLPRVDLGPLADALKGIPIRTGKRADERLRTVRVALDASLADAWTESTRRLKLHLPLLILDEAHHTRNPNTRLAGLFEAPSARQESELLGGPLNGVFDRMLFLTATPFQLAHSELIEVLRRFASVRWDGRQDQDKYLSQIDELNRCLDAAQTAAVRLDESWSQLRTEDVLGVPERWPAEANGELSGRAMRIVERYADLDERNQRAERLMRRYVIRHVRGRRETTGCSYRWSDRLARSNWWSSCRRWIGDALPARCKDASAGGCQGSNEQGSDPAPTSPKGLASSFEAYRNTRSGADYEMEADATKQDLKGEPAQEDWYLSEIDRILNKRSRSVWRNHPKISATVDRAVSLWESGEKVLVFCFYVSTGIALREHISRGLANRTVELGAAEPWTEPQKA